MTTPPVPSIDVGHDHVPAVVGCRCGALLAWNDLDAATRRRWLTALAALDRADVPAAPEEATHVIVPDPGNPTPEGTMGYRFEPVAAQPADRADVVDEPVNHRDIDGAMTVMRAWVRRYDSKRGIPVEDLPLHIIRAITRVPLGETGYVPHRGAVRADVVDERLDVDRLARAVAEVRKSVTFVSRGHTHESLTSDEVAAAIAYEYASKATGDGQ